MRGKAKRRDWRALTANYFRDYAAAPFEEQRESAWPFISTHYALCSEYYKKVLVSCDEFALKNDAFGMNSQTG